MSKLIKFLGGRKAFGFFLIFLISVVFLSIGKFTPENFISFVKWSFLIYVGGNVGKEGAKRIGKK